jgi:ferritin-like metal-binding protein YciE
MKSLHELFVHLLQDIYFAEQQIEKSLPELAQSAKSENLRLALESHLKETKGQIERLDEIFGLMQLSPETEECEAIEGLIDEAQEVINATEEQPVRDAGIIASAQAVEHYEIARYGTLAAWADQLGLSAVSVLLNQTLEEEKKADATLNSLALLQVNQKAA